MTDKEEQEIIRFMNETTVGYQASQDTFMHGYSYAVDRMIKLFKNLKEKHHG